MPEPIEGKDLASRNVFTRNIAAAANLIAIGAALRPQLPITAAKITGKPDDIIFWFENAKVECGGDVLAASEWLTLFLCPWSDFKLPLTHPAAFLKAAAENRQILVAGVKSAKEHAFKVVQRGNRIAVIGAGVTEADARRLMAQQ